MACKITLEFAASKEAKDRADIFVFLGIHCMRSGNCKVGMMHVRVAVRLTCRRMYALEFFFESWDLFCTSVSGPTVSMLLTSYSGRACILYAVMTIEMNLGIICGSLSGVKPVMGIVFPRLFGTTYKTQTHRSNYSRHAGLTTRPDSFPFQTLSGASASAVNKGRDQKVNIAAMNADDKEGRSYAWASSDGHAADSQVPLNAIAVETVVIREEESASSLTRVGEHEDASSEEWIMTDQIERGQL